MWFNNENNCCCPKAINAVGNRVWFCANLLDNDSCIAAPFLGNLPSIFITRTFVLTNTTWYFFTVLKQSHTHTPPVVIRVIQNTQRYFITADLQQLPTPNLHQQYWTQWKQHTRQLSSVTLQKRFPYASCIIDFYRMNLWHKYSV